jgi:protein-L-isoaspartate(D-aspartate) O-methyltransferase
VSEDYRKIELIMALRNQGIRDQAILEAIERTPREMFLGPSFQPMAYADQALPIACGQTISQPYVVAFMTDRLKLNDRCKVLEIGTGSGYQTAILSPLCRRVYTIERYRTLAKEAGERFKALGLANITQMVGDGYKGWPKQAPFDRIIVTAAAREVPPALADQLAIGGIMIIPLEEGLMNQELVRITRDENGFAHEGLLPVRFVPLVEGVARES